MLDEALINVGALRWVLDVILTLVHLEESLSDSLVHDDKGVFWQHGFLVVLERVLLENNLVELLQLMSDDLVSH